MDDEGRVDIKQLLQSVCEVNKSISNFAVDADGEVVSHTLYDPWGVPLTDTEADMNRSGLDNCNNYTGYTWDEVLGLYYAQNRFYDAETHRFTQEDPAQDGSNWYAYCKNNPLIFVDPYGLSATRGYYSTLMCADSTGYNDDIIDMSSLMSYVNKLNSGWSSRLADWSMDLSDWSMDLSGLNSTCSELNDIFNSAEWTTLMNMPHNYINFNYGNLNSELNALNKNLESLNIKLNAVGNAGKQVQAIGIDMSAFNAYFKPITAPTYTASMVLDGIQTGLDVFGLVPGPGEIADGVNAGIYLLRGDYVNAGLSLFSCIPFAGWFGTGGKLAKKGIKAVDAADAVGDTIKIAERADDAYDVAKGAGKAVDAAKGVGKAVDDLPSGWTKTTNNGFTHIKDVNGNIRVRIDPPDAKTPYPHKHLYDEAGNSLDVNGNIVSPKSPDAHIPLK